MYEKIFRQMFYGSMYAKPDVQLVFVVLITHCDRDGNVELPTDLIASMTGLGAERTHAALAELSAPDPKSRRAEEGGA